MEIKGFIKTSLIEWPGKISAVIFVSGCNFRCPFCHNSHLVDLKKIAKLPSLSEKQIIIDLKKRRKWIEGVVITGGEPSLQADLPEFLGKLKKLGFETMIETNGGRPELVQKLVTCKPAILDFLSLDFKAPLDRHYAKTVGLKNFDPKIWIKSLQAILNSGIPFELRTTIVPGIHDKKTLVKMARQLKKIIGRRKVTWFWQNFQPKNCLKPKFNKLKPYDKMEMEKFLKAVKKIIPGTKIRD